MLLTQSSKNDSVGAKEIKIKAPTVSINLNLQKSSALQFKKENHVVHGFKIDHTETSLSSVDLLQVFFWS